MVYKKVLHTLTIILTTCIIMHAQDIPAGGGGVGTSMPMAIFPNHLVGQQFLDDAFNGKYTAKEKYFDIEGSPFLSEEPIIGSLVMNDGKKMDNIPLQLDLFANEIIATTAKGDIIFLNKKHFQEIILPIDGKDVSFRKINEENPDQFYEILFINRDLIFFKEMYVTRKESMTNGINKSPAEFTHRKKYFIKYPNGIIKKVKLKKKQMFKGFDTEDIEAMKKYVKDSKLKLKTEYDYVEVFEAILRH